MEKMLKWICKKWDQAEDRDR